MGSGRGGGHLLCPGGQALPTQRQKTGFWLCGPEAPDPLHFGFCCSCFSLPSSPSEEGCMPGLCTFSEKRNQPQQPSAPASVMAMGGKSRLWGWREGTPRVKGAESGGRILLPAPPHGHTLESGGAASGSCCPWKTPVPPPIPLRPPCRPELPGSDTKLLWPSCPLTQALPMLETALSTVWRPDSQLLRPDRAAGSGWLDPMPRFS